MTRARINTSGDGWSVLLRIVGGTTRARYGTEVYGLVNAAKDVVCCHEAVQRLGCALEHVKAGAPLTRLGRWGCCQTRTGVLFSGANPLAG